MRESGYFWVRAVIEMVDFEAGIPGSSLFHAVKSTGVTVPHSPLSKTDMPLSQARIQGSGFPLSGMGATETTRP